MSRLCIILFCTNWTYKGEPEASGHWKQASLSLTQMFVFAATIHDSKFRVRDYFLENDGRSCSIKFVIASQPCNIHFTFNILHYFEHVLKNGVWNMMNNCFLWIIDCVHNTFHYVIVKSKAHFRVANWIPITLQTLSKHVSWRSCFH